MRTCCWKNGTDRLAQCRVATDLQFWKKHNICEARENEICLYNDLFSAYTAFTYPALSDGYVFSYQKTKQKKHTLACTRGTEHICGYICMVNSGS